MKKILANCRQATFLIEKRMTGGISASEYITLRIHLFGCSGCRLYGKQSRIINDRVSTGIPTAPFRLDEPFKQALKKRIDDELSQRNKLLS